MTLCICAKSLQSCLTLCNTMDHSPPGSSVHGDFPGKNTGVGYHALLQGIFLTKGLSPLLLRLLHFERILYPIGWAGREAPVYVRTTQKSILRFYLCSQYSHPPLYFFSVHIFIKDWHTIYILLLHVFCLLQKCKLYTTGIFVYFVYFGSIFALNIVKHSKILRNNLMLTIIAMSTNNK